MDEQTRRVPSMGPTHGHHNDLDKRLSAAEHEIQSLAREQRKQGKELNAQTGMIKEIHSALVGDRPLDVEDTSGLVKKVKRHGDILQDHEELILEAGEANEKTKAQVKELEKVPPRVDTLEADVKTLKDKADNQKENKLQRFEGLGWGLLAFFLGKMAEGVVKVPQLPPTPGGHP